MIGRNIQKNGDIRTEIIHIIQLEGTEFNDVVFVRVFSYLQRQRVADVTSKSGIIACFLEDMIDKTGGSCLTIRTCDTNHFRIGVATGKFYFADDVNTFLLDFHNHRSSIRNTGTFDNLVGIQDFLFCVMAFFPLNLVVVQHLLVFLVDNRHVAYKHIETFFLG